MFVRPHRMAGEFWVGANEVLGAATVGRDDCWGCVWGAKVYAIKCAVSLGGGDTVQI